MFNIAAYTSLTLSVAASVSGLVIPRATPPAGWFADYLEPYDTYHNRYLALGCQNQHGTPFFDQCCHPLLATEKLETTRPPQCVPGTPATTKPTPIPTPSAVAQQGNGNDDDDDDDLPFCDEDDDGDDSDEQPAAAAAPSPSKAVVKVSAPTSKAAPKPTPSPTPKPAPAPAPVVKAPAPSPAPASDNAVNSGGFATFFFQNGVAGACGTVHKDTDFIAAIDADRYGDTGRKSSLCGRQVKITNTKNKKTVTVSIQDACPTCENSNSIDLSKSAFEQIATVDEGIVPIAWSFV